MQPNGMIFWDWNGTLMDDVDFTHGCLNWMLESHGYPQRYDLAQYRELFRFPIEDYYRLAGFDFSRHPYPMLAEHFMAHYNAGVDACPVMAHAVDTLTELARRGWNVALHYRSNQAAARQVERDILALGGTAKAYQADLTQEAQVEALFAAAEGDFGFVEGLVNNAGTAWKGLFTDMTLGDWRQVLDADLTSVFLCCRRALPPMIRRKRGSIVNVSSMWGQVGASCEAAYSAAKAGVIGLTKALAQEEGPSGIRVNCLAPGVIDTPMNGDLSPEDVAALREETPLGRTGTPREAGEAIAYLLEAEFLTGQVLGLNGGMVV